MRFGPVVTEGPEFSAACAYGGTTTVLDFALHEPNGTSPSRPSPRSCPDDGGRRVCLRCVMTEPAIRPAGLNPGDPGEPAGWRPGDAAKAAIVYRQLPRWSRRLFDLLSSAPGHRFPQSVVHTSLAFGDTPFGVDDACAWAAVFCAASGRTLPVRRHPTAGGQTVYWMDQPAARLFQDLISGPA